MKNFKLKALITLICQGIFILSFWPMAYATPSTLIPIGQTVGITLDMNGVMVMGIADVIDYDGKSHSPSKDSGIKTGDTILEINGTTVTSVKEFEDIINKSGSNTLNLKIKRADKIKTCRITPILSKDDGHYKIGAWIKDAVSGIGTITYLNPETMEFGALGHPISQAPDSNALSIADGSILKSNIVSIKKGEKGSPGELVGVFSEDKEELGKITSNTAVGIKGEITAPDKIEGTPIEIADRGSVSKGDAYILSNIEGDKIEKFSVEIQNINKNPNSTKGMVVKITDSRLLEKTGGIVQGMSGSPIVQNGKLVGAVTHVFVNDPTRGYGIFIENMLAETEKIK